MIDVMDGEEQQQRGLIAIQQALKALRKRHLLEEGAHAPAFLAISRPLTAQGSEWKEKLESLELELQQCYKAQARLSEQLVIEVAECRTSKALLQEKEEAITALQNEVTEIREESSQLKASLEEKIKALDLVISENQALKAQLEEAILKAQNAVSENKMLIDRWMLQKMQDAERLNEGVSDGDITSTFPIPIFRPLRVTGLHAHYGEIDVFLGEVIKGDASRQQIQVPEGVQIEFAGPSPHGIASWMSLRIYYYMHACLQDPKLSRVTKFPWSQDLTPD